MTNNVNFENNTDVIDYLGSSDNTSLSKLNNSDKVQMIFLLKQYYLSLRSTLGLCKEYKFGLEIEYEECNRDIISRKIDDLYLTSQLDSTEKWIHEQERSIKSGGECISPILCDTKEVWHDVNLVCQTISENAKLLGSAGGHIHIGWHILGNNPKYWANFLKLWTAYENIIYRFLYGEFINPRPSLERMANPLALEFYTKMNQIEKCATYVNASILFEIVNNDLYHHLRHSGISFYNTRNLQPYEYNLIKNKHTIEYRCPNGTFDAVIWQNNVNFLIKLMLYAKADDFNEELINTQIQQMVEQNIASNLRKYSYIDINKAIELSDLIFDNNLDKIYFLRQYLKDGTVKTEDFSRSRKFTI